MPYNIIHICSSDNDASAILYIYIYTCFIQVRYLVCDVLTSIGGDPKASWMMRTSLARFSAEVKRHLIFSSMSQMAENGSAVNVVSGAIRTVVMPVRAAVMEYIVVHLH